MSSAACQVVRLVGDDAHRLTGQPAEADDDVPGVVGLDLEEIAVVDDLPDHLADVVGQVGVVRDQGVELVRRPVPGVRGLAPGWVAEVVVRDEGQQLADEAQGVFVVLGLEVGDAAQDVMRFRSAQLLHRHLFVGHGLDDVGAGDEHVARVAGHDDEVGDGGGIDRPAGAGPQDGGDLGNDARGEDVPQEDVGIAGQAGHALLDPRPARVIEPDDGRAGLHGQVHDLDDLAGVGAGERAAEDGEVLGEDEDRPAVDPAVAGDDPVAVDSPLLHAEVPALVEDQLVHFLE